LSFYRTLFILLPFSTVFDQVVTIEPVV